MVSVEQNVTGETECGGFGTLSGPAGVFGVVEIGEVKLFIRESFVAEVLSKILSKVAAELEDAEEELRNERQSRSRGRE